ncbi:hypothetical protein EVB32_179 [Rhizobium phage RHph_TM39]|uniref:Uncharacterized protein n=2 Tax=Cuauhnahuacvirus TaxID=3044696 RepID=A0A7S5RH40_9CAUD|nr:hypothetical protein PQC16_gp180 [Rhizobium phage RHph_TM30]YP_010671330.1 hypothetical protein PQC17_gp181 [Rhizobium phage RHph_Y65]QIG71650.1 hypothetical protein EVB94_179 [Rhizobium phage RHph_TM40]QIG72013.1 hypothetical protein EVB95_179 [Rhizobium phage RHph_TM2_3B]QIG72376.1 hypothetical protein EVB96_180 [Rhizobium phage RHph_TM3_3_6]QIG77167.1 hypothetical protein EVB32_179 [Rhizobium phage RHph_TM39]QIG77766.1 hypothetical protein EVB64_179 [Rhizobium phage RHph_TM61]
MKLTRTEVYQINGKETAHIVASKFAIDGSLFNKFYLEVNDKVSAPRLIRDYIDTLQLTIPDKVVYILSLEKTEIRTTDFRKKNNEQGRRPTPKSE